MREKYNTDIFSFRQSFYRGNPKYYNTHYKDTWYESIFPNLTLEVKSNIKLYEKGNTLGGIEYENKKITNIEISSTMFLLFLLMYLRPSPIYKYQNISGIDSYFSVLFGSILGLIPLCIILYLFNYQIDKPINEKNKIIFGKTVGTIINYLTIPFLFILGITYLFNLGNFVISQYLTNTPLLIIIIVISLTSLFIANKGIKVITKTSSIYSIIIIIVFPNRRIRAIQKK